MQARITYEKTTPESAADGDVSDRGFYAPGGYHDSILGSGGEGIVEDARNGEYDLSLSDAVTAAQRLGCSEYNDDGPDGFSVRSVDPAQNREFFEEGVETLYTVHFAGLRPGTKARVRRLLGL